MARRLAWFAIAAAAAYVVFLGGAWLGIYEADLRIVTVTITAVLLGCWAWLARRRPAWRPRSSLLPAIVLALASLAISTVFSREPRISLEYLGYAILLGSLYLFAVTLFREPFFRPRLVVLGALLFGVISVIYLVHVAAHWVTWWATLGYINVPPLRPEFEAVTYGNPSALLTIVTLLAVAPAARWGGSSRRGVAMLALVSAVVAAIALLSGSRAGWFALGISATLGVIVWLAGAGRRDLARSWLRPLLGRVAGRVMLLAAGLAALALFGILAPSIIRRIGEGGEDLRLSYVVIALRLFVQSPIVGTGPGTWVIQRGAETLPTETDYYIPHAHDVPAQTLAELGLIGAVVGILAVVSVAGLIRRAARSEDGDIRRWGWLTGLALLYFGLHNLLDFYANAPAILVAAALPIAYLDATLEPQPFLHLTPRFRNRALMPVTAVVAVAVCGLLVQEVPALKLQRAVDAINDGNWAGALQPAREAADADPDIASGDFTAGLAAAHMGDDAAAAAYFERVVSHDDLPEAWLDLAAERAHLGNTAGAVEALRSALRLGAQRSAIAMPAGVLALSLGANDLAEEALTAAVTHSPSLMADPWWDLDAHAKALKARVTDEAIAAARSTNGWEIALMAGDPDLSRSLVPPSIDVQAAEVIDAWLGDPAAAARLQSGCLSDPGNVHELLWCARIAQRNGDPESASRFRYLADAQIGGISAEGVELRVSTRWTIEAYLAGSPAIYWGTFTYRRPTAYDMFVPSLVHLARQ